jgi:predicted nucleotidyltransferase
MSATSLDYSRLPELALHAKVLMNLSAVTETVSIQPLIVGAFARDLHLQYNPYLKHAITISRKTSDIDFAVSVPDWATFEACVSG